MRIESWYIPRSRPTFLLVNKKGFYVPQVPPGLGVPSARVTAGAITMLIYPYDIASRLGPPPN
jgi:hypothetical protein